MNYNLVVLLLLIICINSIFGQNTIELIAFDCNRNKSSNSDISDIKFKIVTEHKIISQSTKSKYDEFKLFLKQFQLNLITGGRFSHICSKHDKGNATKLFIEKTKKFFNNSNIITVGIGDSKNDFEMLSVVDFPCIVKSPNNHLLKDSLNTKNITFSDHEAPSGWIECIEKVVTKIRSSGIANV